VNSDKQKRKLTNARELALLVLNRVEQDRSYSNLLLNQMLRKHKLQPGDKALVTQIVYGTIQRLNTIDFFLDRFVNKGVHKLETWVKNLLRLSFYQLYYLERIPPHAVVDEAVRIAKSRGHSGVAGMVNAVLRNVLRQEGRLVIPEEIPTTEQIALRHSHPRWLVERWAEQYGLRVAEQICGANNGTPHTSVRVNTLSLSRDELIGQMRQNGLRVMPSPLAPSGVIVEGGGNMADTRWYREGMLTIQDESSMLVAEIADPKPGMRVLDCCAAPGGKTTHLAEKMHDRGEVWAGDLHPHKVRLIAEQARRLHLHSVRALASDARELPGKFEAESFDCIVLDAPCTGFGVIRRKPDLKWFKDERDVAALSSLQYDILRKIQSLLKPGGTLVYSTCTIGEEENGNIIKKFLREFPDFAPDTGKLYALPEEIRNKLAVDGMVQILPQQYNSDGFFIAKLRKRG